MLIINECGLSTAVHEKMKAELAALIGSGRRAYLIVPEQQTVITESEMARELPESAPLYFEVTNFTRLADSTFRTLGGICTSGVDSARRALIMWRTLTELSPKLDMTRGRSDISDGLVKKALAALAEIDAAAIEDEELFTLSERADIGARLQRKISDITLIRSLFCGLLSEKYGVGDDASLRCARLLSEHPKQFEDAVFFVEGFTSFTEPQYRILTALMKRTELTLLLPLSKYEEDCFEYSEIRSTKSRICDVAKHHGVAVKLLRGGTYSGDVPIPIAEAMRLIWRTDGTFDNDSLQNADCLRIFEAHTPFDECDFVAEDIRRRVIAGASYSDFAIIARSPDEYFGILDVALEKSNIPYFMSHTQEISQNEAIKFIYTAYAAAEKFRREDVISYMKCGFCDVERERADEFEIYVERWGISGSSLAATGVFNMNPDGYTTRKREDSAEELLRINETKEKIIAPLRDFSKKTRGAHSVREHAELLYDFLVSMHIEEKLDARGDDAKKLWRVIVDSLDALVDALGDMNISAEVFLSQLKVLFTNVEIGRIPTVIDEVTVGGAELLRLSGKSHIYMLGVNQGKFPKNPKDESYFSERDKAILAAHEINIAPDLELRCARELFFFSRAMSFAGQSVTILYSLASTDFKAIPRGEVISRLSAISHELIKPIKICELRPSERIFSPSLAAELSQELTPRQRAVIDSVLSYTGHKPYPHDELGIDNGTLALSGEGRKLIYSGESLNLTQTRIDSFVKCPLNYFCKYNLALSDTEPYEVNYSGIGSFVHAILENFFAHTESTGKDPATMSKEERETVAFDASKKYLSELSGDAEFDTQTKILLLRLYRATLPVVEDICDELSGSRFKPKFFELNIRPNSEDNPEPITLSYPDGSATVYGQIDRVDTFTHDGDVYVKVIDYKTGTKRFSPDDIKNGENLQMFLYLKSIVESKNQKFKERIGLKHSGKLIPAGVVYVKTSLSDVKVNHDDTDEITEAIKKNQGRDGMILDDPISIAAQNPEYSPVKYRKDGTPLAASEKYLYTPDGWDELMNTVEEVIGGICAKMRSGDIHAEAKGHRGEKLPCEYCEYKPFCRKSTYG